MAAAVAEKVLPVTCNVALDAPPELPISMKRPSSPATVPLLWMLQALMVRSSVPNELSMPTFLAKPPVISDVLMEQVPLSSAKLMLPSLKGLFWFVPLVPSRRLFERVKALTLVPRMP